jgi:hypothetical protein
LVGIIHDANNSAKGVTFETVEYPLVEMHTVQWKFFDTVGLDEPESGKLKISK